MRYITHSFRYADVILQQPEFAADHIELLDIVRGVTDADIIHQHDSYGIPDVLRKPKSLSVAINHILKEHFIQRGWAHESPIFNDGDYQDNRWRLDFAKPDTISVEVAFNHAGSIAWNMIKPVLASELNHVRKAMQTRVGVIITATNAMRTAGGFDPAIGTFETFQNYLKPFNGILTTPMLIIGLEPPESFRIVHTKPAPRKTIGEIVML